MILIIDNYDSFTYNLYQSLATIARDIRVIRNDKISVNQIKELRPEGIILSPGPGRPEDAGICVALVKQLSGLVPILGICLGHQAIAVAFEGQVVKSSEIIHGKVSTVTHHQGILYRAIPKKFTAGRYHSLIVDRASLPSQLCIESELDDGMIMGLRHNSNPTFGIQFHPESILSDYGQELLNNFIKNCYMQEVLC